MEEPHNVHSLLAHFSGFLESRPSFNDREINHSGAGTRAFLRLHLLRFTVLSSWDSAALGTSPYRARKSSHTLPLSSLRSWLWKRASWGYWLRQHPAASCWLPSCQGNPIYFLFCFLMLMIFGSWREHCQPKLPFELFGCLYTNILVLSVFLGRY